MSRIIYRAFKSKDTNFDQVVIKIANLNVHCPLNHSRKRKLVNIVKYTYIIFALFHDRKEKDVLFNYLFRSYNFLSTENHNLIIFTLSIDKSVLELYFTIFIYNRFIFYVLVFKIFYSSAL